MTISRTALSCLLRSAIYFTGAALVLLFALSLHEYEQAQSESTLVKQEGMSRLVLADRVTSSELREVMADLQTLAARGGIAQYLHAPNETARLNVEGQFHNFEQNYRRYEHIRLLDLAGNELVRVDYREGASSSAGPESLQARSTPALAGAARTLKPGEIYIAPLELTVENGVLVRPFKPTLAVATVIFDQSARPQAILVVNYLAASLLSRFRDVVEGAPGAPMLLNAAGYWLHATNPVDEWGFARNQEATFARRYPAAWPRIAAEEAGTVDGPGGNFVFRTLRLGPAEFSTRSAEVWKMVIQLPAAPSFSPQLAWQRHPPLVAMLLLLTAAISTVLAWLRTVEIRKRNALAESRRRLAEAHSIAHLGHWERDLRRDTLTWSDEIYRIFGHPPHAFVPTYSRYMEAVHPDDRRRLQDAVAAAQQAADGAYGVEYGIVLPDGQVRTVSESGRVVRDDAGRPLRIAGMLQDISERKRVEAALLRSEQEFHALAERSPDLVARFDRELRTLYINPAIERPSGFPPAYFLGKDIRTLDLPVQGRSRWVENALAVFETAQERSFEYMLPSPDGKEHILSCSIVPEFDTQGRVETIISVSRDVTPLREAEARVRLLLDSVGEGVYGMDKDGNCTFLNPEALRLLGYSDDHELMGRNLHDLMHHSRPDGTPMEENCRIRRAFREGKDFHVDDEVFWRRDGTSFAVEYRARPMFKRGKLDGAVVSFIDITARRAMEAALRESEAKLRAQAQELAEGAIRKDQFIATLGHELRNPLVPIRNAFEIIMRAPEREAALSAAAIGERQVAQLVRLVDDLLEVSRISRGMITLHRTRVALKEIVDTAVETSEPFVHGASHELSVELPAEPVFLDADLTRIAQAISNLLINAAKFTEGKGRIRLAARRGEDEVSIAVQDTGIGIEPAMLPHIFEMFMQAEPGDRQGRGLGIGLALVRSLVDLHGGRVEAASPGPGRGATFTIHLPLAPAAASTQPPPPAPLLAVQAKPHHRILVVDDNCDVAQSTALMLEIEGHEVRTAPDGTSAIKAALEQPPEVAILDLGLPDMDGYELARRLRAEPALRDTRLIAMTGRGPEREREGSPESDFNYYLVKPVEPATLLAIVREAGVRAAEPAVSM